MVLLDDLHSGFFTNAGHTGNIIGSIPHKGFYVDKFQRCHAIFFHNVFCVVIFSFCASAFCFGNTHFQGFSGNLQQVPVTGNHNRNEPCILCLFGKTAQNVIGFIAFLFVDGNMHSSKDFLQQRHLLPQFLGHPLSGTLISIKSLMPECRRMHIKCHCQIIRLVFI